MKNIFSICLLIIVMLIACNKDSGRTIYSSRISDSLNEIIDPLYQSKSFSGTILIADDKGVLYRKAFGLADRIEARPLSTQTPFYLASVSKQFTASAIMLLEQDGLLSFDDGILQYLKELPSTVYDKITVRHLLNHTSGIPDYYNFANPTPGFTNSDVYKILQEVDALHFEPGEQYRYSNSGYVLLSILVDKITEGTFANFMNERILDPLNMVHCTVKDEYAAEISNPAVGYNRDGEISDYRFNTTGGGGIYASVEDMYLWDRALYTGDIVHLDVLKDEAWVSGVLNSGKKTGYGFGWTLDPERPHIVRHGGELEGFRTHFFRDTDLKIAIIVLSNSGYDDVRGLCDRIYALIEGGE